MIRLSSSDFVGIATNQPISDNSLIHVYTAGDVTVSFLNDTRFTGETVGTGGVVVTGESVGTGDGVTVTFALANSPVSVGSDVVYIDGIAQVRDTDYTIDYTAGTITFSVAPASAAAITADYTYLLKVYSLANGNVVEYSDVIYLDGVKQERGVDYTIDYPTGIITFATYVAAGVVITADYVAEISYSKTVSASVGDDIAPMNGAVSVTSVGTIGIHSL